MKRRPLTKAQLLDRMPRAFRRKLTAGQQLDLSLVHHQHLDAIAKGEGTEETLWQWVGAVLTWSKTAELLDAGVLEMADQLQLANSLVERYGRTGRVGFSGVEYQLAKHGVDVMDALAAAVDQPTAERAADWSERELARLSAECAIRRAGQAAAAVATSPAPRAVEGVATV